MTKSELICREIYRQAFCDENSEFEDNLFSLCYKYCKTLNIEGNPVSMLFSLPCNLVENGQKTDAFYIYAAATLENHRGKGYMQKLINNVLNCNDAFFFLRPSTDSLIEFYRKLGFKEVKTSLKNSSCPKIYPKENFDKLINTGIECDKTDFVLMYYKEQKELYNLNFSYSME